jgi:hypothetical protein
MTAEPDVTIIGLIYRSKAWLNFMHYGLRTAVNTTPTHLMIVGNDPEPEVAGDERITHVYNDPAPKDHYASRTYRCWNWAAAQAKTKYIVFFNSDMFPADGWVDDLYRQIEQDPKTIPCSLLIESGRIPSAMPEWVQNLGFHPKDFKPSRFYTRAAELREPGVVSKGRLYMPCILNREEFLARGGYPTSAHLANDVTLWRKMIDDGYQWLTCHGSVVYHVCSGEMAAK